MVSSVPASLISSKLLAVSKLLLVSHSSSWDMGRRPKPLVALLSFSERARGASLVPVPGFKHCRQCFGSSQCSNPGRVRGTVADPGGKVKHATRSFSPVASASS
eukprot:2738137-Pyramimonas_sp.AAC.1